MFSSPRPILIIPNDILRQKSKPLPAVRDEHRVLMDEMLQTMYDANGIGLAAPQIGILEQLVVIDVRHSKRYADTTNGANTGAEHNPQPLYMVNPEITWQSDELNKYAEGCLSIPEVFGNVVRPKQVTVRFWDYYGKEQELTADYLLATCIQHEIDHLRGKLFIDYLSPLKKSMIVRKFNKRHRAELKAKESKIPEKPHDLA